MTERCVAVIDFGSQTTMLIARRIRELSVMAQVFPPSITAADLAKEKPVALIFSGGPESMLDPDALRIDPAIFELGLPLLGICYGMQLLVDHFAGKVFTAQKKEFGRREIELDSRSALFNGIDGPLAVWMSHCDQVDITGTAFSTIATSTTCHNAAIAWPEQKIYGVQFHPEVSHSEKGCDILKNFIFTIAGLSQNFVMSNFLADTIESIKAQVGDAHVVMGLSGGVDSSVAAVLIHKAIGNQLHCVYVNHGLHRAGEIEEVSELFSKIYPMDVQIVDAQEQFFSALAGVTDPEEKRKKIGHTFVDVFEQEARRLSNIAFLGQGTLYPDVIESNGANGSAHLIKTHHNVGGVKESMKLSLLEPLRDLFKDEVRLLGDLLGLPKKLLLRQPFPGPGLAIRIPGEVTQKRVDMLKKADAIVREEIDMAFLQGHITKPLWQWFAVLLPVKSVGVMGDARTYGQTVVIRCVESQDAMTADFCKLSYEVLQIISSRITNEVWGVSRVLYDITQKPPGTIEWE